MPSSIHTKRKITQEFLSKRSKCYSSLDPSSFQERLPKPSLRSNIDKLNEELLNLFQKLTPKLEEIAMRKIVIDKLKSFLKVILPDFQFHTFGSYENKMFLYNSDIDIVLIGDADSSNSVLRYIIEKIENVDFLDRSFILHIRNARVPILKLRDVKFGIEMDISVNKKDSLEHAEFIKQEIAVKPYLRIFCLLLKYFLKLRGLTDSRYGGLCSYAQFLMVSSFFQLHPLIQSGVVNPLSNLGVLFMDFFQFYGIDFPYEGVTVSVKDKRYVKQRISCSIISLEDPCNVEHDVGDNCAHLYSVKDVFTHAYRIMGISLKKKVESSKSLLSLWMTYGDKIEKDRSELVEKYKKM